MSIAKKFILPCIIGMVLFACSGDSEKAAVLKEETKDLPTEPEDPIVRDLEQIKADGVLKAITTFSPTSYFLYRGQPMGFEYELLQRLADHLGLKLEIVVAENLDMVKLLNMLNSGEGDIIAHGLTVTEKRKEYVRFTHRHFESHQVLVQRKPANWRKMKLHNIEDALITNPLDLIGKVVYVRDRSPYHQRLLHLQEEMGGKIIIKPVLEDISTNKIIKEVVDGEINYTVADNNIAAINATYYPILDINTAVSFPQQIAWAIRLNSPNLLQVVNSWIDEMKTQADYNVLYNKYFKNRKLYKEHLQSEFFSLKSGKISEFDELIKKNAVEIGWDWRLLSSLIYQESRFDPKATSWAGGEGLMQLMPATAEELGVTKRSDPVQNIQGGAKYLDKLFEQWEEIPDSIHRIKFTLASYNCGYQHVRDAQRLAEKNNGDQKIWDGEVEEYLLLLSSEKYYQDEVVQYGYCRGEEPYKYVREIFERFDQYKQFIPLEVN